jgi:hypothetical protein
MIVRGSVPGAGISSALHAAEMMNIRRARPMI